jgi:hypothetical protein
MIFSAVILVAILSCADAVERLTYPCHRLAQAPVIDGNINDAAWKNIPEATGFFIFKSGGSEKYAVEKQTSFKAGWTADAVYIVVRAEESAPEKMIAMEKDGGALWSEDSIEVFLFPTGAPAYTQLIANSAGSRWNGRIASMSVAGWEAKAVVGKTEWVLELCIPFAVLAAKPPKEGDEWPVNVARNIRTGPADEYYTCWPPLRTGFHDVANFGRFGFKGLAADMAVDEEKELNAAFNAVYFPDMHERMKKLAGLAKKYEQELGEAQKTENQRIEAEKLLQIWGQVARLAAQSNPDYVELKSVRGNCIGLPQRSEDCIARGMLEMMFKE